MDLASDSLVIVLGPRGANSVLNVDTVANVLAHISQHVASEAALNAGAPHDHGIVPPPAGEGQERILRFFTPEGQPLALQLISDWWTFVLKPSGWRVPVRRLRAEVYGVLEAHRAEVEDLFKKLNLEPPPLPPPGTWPEQLRALSGDLRLVLPGGVIYEDRRGWFHNLFVHGGNP